MINDITNIGTFLEINAEEAGPGPGAPNEENEFVYAKTFLQKNSSVTGDNLYDHLSEVLNKILSERPENVVDFFEEYCRKVKEKRFKPLTDHLEDIYVAPGRFRLANQLMPLLKPLPIEGPSTVDPEDLGRADMTRNNMLELLHYFEICGFGLPRTEMFCLMMSMRQLIRVEPIAKVTFWGKIFGTQNNYLILEAELKDEEHSKRNENYVTAYSAPEQDSIIKELYQIQKNQEITGENDVSTLWETLPPLPQSNFEKPPETPPELSGVGVNKYAYYVCNEVGQPWVQLPDATPAQIRVARQICKAFTGDLDQPIISYPFFPGTERNYLRAQIARISAGTHIAPEGFYIFGGQDLYGEDVEEAPEAVDKTEIQENPSYQPPQIEDLIQTTMSYWVHIKHHILNQGRTTWWNPNPLPVLGEDAGEGGEDADFGIAIPEPETGPGLLSHCSEDHSLGPHDGWSVKSSSDIADEFAVAIVRSNLWPGAYCFSTQGKIFQNVYFGSGLKASVPNFSPNPLPPVEQDYPIGPEILEIHDPTGAEEEQWRIAHLPKEMPVKMGLGEEEEVEGEEEEEEEDEDDD